MITYVFGGIGAGKTTYGVKLLKTELDRIRSGKSPYKHLFCNFYNKLVPRVSMEEFGKKVFPFTTLINKGIVTRKTPKLHIKVVIAVSVKKDNITSWASCVPPSFTKYHNIEVQVKCIIAPGIQVNKVPTNTIFALFFETGLSIL